MSDTDESDLFGDDKGNGAGNQPGDKGVATGDQTDLFDQLVGDGKKFKTKEDLAKAKLEADKFIEQLKGEQAQIRTDFANLQEVVKTLSKNGGQQGKPADAGGQPAVDISNLEETVARVLESRTQEQAREKNLSAAVETLVQTLGSKEAAKAAINKRAAELGVTPQKLKEDAAASPQYFLTVMGVTAKQGGSVAATKPSNSSAPVRTGASAGVPGKSHFDALRKENPREYYSPKVQNALFKARMELGEQFYQL